jgi:prepilin-type N-terminal cleavage/methylation domain-containing protein
MNKNNTKRGFTMAELIVVMGILAILFTLSVNTYKNQRDQTSFNNSLIDILSVIKTARDYASTSKAAGNTGQVPVDGYGVYIDKANKKLILFANNGSDANKYNTTEAAPGGKDGIEQEYMIPAKTNFKSLQLILIKNGVPTPVIGDKAAIIFRPPLADVSITDNGILTVTEFTELRMQFAREAAPDAIKTIKINKIAGFPEIEL